MGVEYDQRRARFEEQRVLLQVSLDRAGKISNSVANKFVAPRFAWATWIFARMCLNARSVLLLVKNYLDDEVHSTVDHVSIIGICRTILESQIFLAYLTEVGISEDEWQLRKWTLDLHDCVTRIRLFRGIGDTEQKGAFKAELERLKARMEGNGVFPQLPVETRNDVLVGRRIYVRGMRNALKLADWPEDLWDGIYSYLSGAIHSSPVSFYRYADHGVNNLSITPYQLGLMSTGWEFSHKSLDWAADCVARLFSEAGEAKEISLSEQPSESAGDA